MKLSPDEQYELTEHKKWISESQVRFIVQTTADLFRQWMTMNSSFWLDEPVGPDDGIELNRLIEEEIGVCNWRGYISPAQIVSKVGQSVTLEFELTVVVDDEEKGGWTCILTRIQQLDDKRCEVVLWALFPFCYPPVSSFLSRVSTSWPDIDMYSATREWGGGQIGLPRPIGGGVEPTDSKSLPIPSQPLTNAEKEIAVLLAQGKSDQEISEERVTSESTVATQRKSIAAKLGIEADKKTISARLKALGY